MRTNYKRIKNIITKHYDVEIEQSPSRGVIAIFERNVSHLRIVLVDGYYDSHTEQGIHLRQLNSSNLEHYLVDAVETALKDQFPTIYIHQSTRDSKERCESRRDSIKSWFDKPWFGANLSSLEVDAEEILSGMNDQQLALMSKCISAAYQSGAESSRKFWSPKFHNLRKALIERGLSDIEAHDIADAVKAGGAS